MSRSRLSVRSVVVVLVVAGLAVSMAAPAWAQGEGAAEPNVSDTLWVLMAAFLVFFMQAGFALVEAGFTQAKNTANILMKNLFDFSAGSLMFWGIGFALMFGAGNAFLGTRGFFLQAGADANDTFSPLAWANVPLAAKFIFQLVFAATAATIVSGAMAERTKFKSYVVYSVFITGLIYPIAGHWIWGGGWLAELGMWDFAGSTVVHSCGGWLALVGAVLLGPRFGKYGADGRATAIPGHSLSMAALGTFILWLGWFGFNPGSTMAADPGAISHIAVTTNIAAACGLIAAMTVSWLSTRKPDPGLSMNGALAGLVAITAGCAFVSPASAALIGMAAGVLMVYSVRFFDRIRVDDPVGAISVHGVCGALGTLAVGLFAQESIMPGTTGNGLLFGGGATLLGAQAIGVLAMAGWCGVTGLALFGVIKLAIGLRVNAQEEIEGLDIHEHGSPAYPEPFVAVLSNGARLAAPPSEAPAAPAVSDDGDAPDRKPALAPVDAEPGGISQVTAIIRPSEIDKVQRALERAGILGITVTDVRGCGKQGGVREQFRGTEYVVSLLPKVRIDVMVPDHQVDAVVDAIVSGSRTGEVGDGKVFVAPLRDAVRVRTGEQGTAAL